MLENIWHYRQFIYSCVKRDFKARYTGSMLGVLWTVFQPLAMILVYTLIFSQVMRSKLAGMESVPYSYSIYLCAGVLTWGMFQEMLFGCINVFFSNANLMKKVSFPRICLPAITVCSSFLNFIIGFVIFCIFMLIIGKFPWSVAPLLLLVLAVQVLFTVGLGIGLGVLNVFFRDIGQMMGVILQFWFWFTPVVYPLTIVPKQFVWLMNLNPMYHVISAYQSIFVYGRLPDLIGLFGVLAFSLLLSAWSLHLYRKHVGELVDEL
ncbi:ABC transporter permease [Selenomonas sp. KH1T6]|uniref:ABC transporter permease n=1 Tax=Selenomonas sp. KH1T6 TaxID=3158784 RepID=UPI0008A799F3|nr:lipopolysaccharide transport system permease protein [Selenomonas ruminantium]